MIACDSIHAFMTICQLAVMTSMTEFTVRGACATVRVNGGQIEKLRTFVVISYFIQTGVVQPNTPTSYEK